MPKGYKTLDDAAVEEAQARAEEADKATIASLEREHAEVLHRKTHPNREARLKEIEAFLREHGIEVSH